MFITFEGPEGSGKSTQIRLLAQYLEARGHIVQCTREPGGTAIGEQIREVVHRVDNVDMNPVAEILLYSASRAQLVAQFIQPTLAQGDFILCDRYIDSTYAYQGYGHGLSLEDLQGITQFATQNLKPDVTYLLDVPVEVGLARKQEARRAEAGEWNRMDQMALAFHQRVRQGYLALAQVEPKRWRTIDATQAVEVIYQEICLHLECLLSIGQNR